MWYQIQFPQEISLAELDFTANQTIKKGWKPKPGAQMGPPPFIQTFPRAFVIEVSSDGQHWREVSTQTKGMMGENIIALNGMKAKFLKLRLSESLPDDSDEIPWSMRQLKVFVQ